MKTVNGKPHATEDDHISSDAATSIPLPTPPDSGRQSRSKRASQAREPAAAATSVTIDEDEQTVAVNEQKEDSDDPNRDPVSSDEEDMAGKKEGSMGFVAMKANALKEASPEQIKAKFKGAKRTAAAEEEPVKKIAFCKPSVTSADIVDPKKVLDDGDLDNDDPDFITNSQPTKKRAKTSNIHAAPRSSQINVFGREQAEKLRKKEEHERKKRKIKEQKEKEKKKFQVISLPAAGFKRHNLSGLQAGNTIAGAASCISSQDGASSPLSSLTPSPEPDPMGIVCETCHQRVDKLLKEEYDDDYVKGKSWNIQWQERFCEWHRTQTAKQEWEKRGYPEIKWTDLEHRMRRHDDSVLSVLRNQAKSRHRDDYGAKVKAKSMSSGFKDTAIKPGATVGYYGPKGEKAMCVYPDLCLELLIPY